MSEEPRETLGRRLTRKEFVAGSAAVGFGLALAACGGDEEPKPAKAKGETAPLKDGLAEGMYGGPTGFEGAERYQYPLDSEEGRAIFALRRLRQDATAPQTLLVVHRDRDIMEEPVTEGAPSHVEVFEEETGIKIEFVRGTEFVDFIAANRKAAETRDGGFDVVHTISQGVPDHAEAGFLRPLDDFVETYQPSWLDPQFGYAGGAPVVNHLTRHRESTVAVGYRNLTQVWAYRADLLEDPAERAEFEDRYGRELRFPLTWDEQAQVAEFFHRPASDPPLYGSVEPKAAVKNQAASWAMRFVCAGNPNFFLFNEDGSANVNTDAGLQATTEHRRSLEWSEPGALEGDPGDLLEVYAAGLGFMGSVWAWMLSPDSPSIEKLKAGVAPGRILDGALVRRPNAGGHFVLGVNGFADESRHEAAYLFLQWLGGARVNSWLALSPGFSEPLHFYAMEDPRIDDVYGESTVRALAESMPRSAPWPGLPGGWLYWSALHEQLGPVLLDEQSPEAAMKNLEDRWNAITDELGAESQADSIASFRAGYSDLVDDPPDS